MKKKLLFLLWLFTGCAASLSAQIITRIAGGGSGSLSATGTPATGVPLNFPTGVALNSAGEVLIATNYSNYVVKVDNAGLIVHIAGTGSGFYSGDGGPASAAEVNTPTGVAADAAGNIYFADSWNQRIRKVSTSGIITTVAGNGTYGFSGDGGPATAATLADPISVTADAAGNLFIVDKGNHVIRKVNTAGIITRVAGTGTSGYNADGISALGSRLNTPEAVAVDAAGNLYIADFYNNRVRKVSTTGIISTIAGTGVYGFSGDGGPATDAQVQYPAGVAVDAAGNVYISDQNSHRIRMINTAGIITTIAGTGVSGFNGDGLNATATDLDGPYRLVVDALGNIYFPDAANGLIRKLMLPNISGTARICVGSTTSLTDTASGGVWSSSAPAIATVNSASGLTGGIAAGTAAITYRLGTMSTVRVVTIDALPPAAITGRGYTCVGSLPDTLTGTPTGGVWSSLYGYAGMSGNIAIGLSPGTDTIQYTVINACGTTGTRRALTVHSAADCPIVSSVPTVSGNAAAPIDAYPNPGNGQFTIAVPGHTHCDIAVYNLQGRRVLSQSVHHARTTTIDLLQTNAPPGTYLLVITAGSNVYTHKIERSQ